MAKKAKRKRPDEQVGTADVMTIRLALVIAVIFRLLTGH
jgi:hypothetical protein